MGKILEFVKKNKIDFIFLLSMLFVAIVLRVIAIQNYGALAEDEPYSWRFAAFENPIEVIKQVFKLDIHMPLYFVYLHLWIKVFGDSLTSLHVSSLVLFLPLMPFVFWISNKFFNKTTAYFSTIFIALSSFCIYYSIYVRFYVLIMPLSLLLAYFFVKMLERFDKKYVIGFILTHFFLLYTFNLTSVLSLAYAVVGFIYLIVKKRNLFNFLLVYSIILLTSAHAIYMIITNMITLRTALCSHSVEFFMYNPRAVFDFIENFFTGENFQLSIRTVAIYKDYLAELKNPMFIFFSMLPVLLCLAGFVRSFIQKNEKLLLFVLPSIITTILVFVLSHFEVMYYQTKYLCIVYPVIIITTMYGLSLFKKYQAGMIVFLTVVFLNAIYPLSQEVSILNYHNRGEQDMHDVFDSNNISKNDIVLSPFVPDVFRYFHQNRGILIPFSYDEALLLKNREPLRIYFGDKIYSKLTRENALEVIAPFIEQDTIPQSFEKYMLDYFKKLEVGQKFVVFNSFVGSTIFFGNVEVQDLLPEDYHNVSVFNLYMAKLFRDVHKLAEEYFELADIYENNSTHSKLYFYSKKVN